MRNRSVLTVLLILAAGLAQPALAGVGRFTNVSPEGASVSDLVVDPVHPSTVYALTGGGIYRSDDGGDSWRLSFDPSETTSDGSVVENRVTAIAIDPAHSGTLYGGTSGGQVTKTVDAGRTWSLLDGLRQPNSIVALVLDPSGTSIFALTRSSLLRSTDQGLTWNSSAAVPEDASLGFRSLAIDARLPTRLYLGTARGFYKSVDSGAFWSLVPSAPAGVYESILVGPDDSSVTAAGSLYGGNSVFFIGDADRGVGVVRSNVPDSVFRLIPDPNSSAVYGLVYPSRSALSGSTGSLLVSRDRWQSWTLVHTFDQQVSALALDPNDPRRMYAAVRGDLLRSEDGGTDFHSSHAGLNIPYVYDTQPDPADSSKLTAATEGGLFDSTDGGRHWSSETLATRPTGLSSGPQHPARFAFNYDSIRRSVEGGAWTEIVTDRGVLSMAVDPANPAKVYAGMADGLKRSTDGGATFSYVGSGQLPFAYYGFFGVSLAVDPKTPSHVYAASSIAVVKSVDGGTNWAPILSSKEHYEDYGVYFRAVVLDASTPSTVYALSTDRLFRSEDGGESWVVLLTSPERTAFSDLISDPLQPSTLYLLNSSGISRSVDRGEHWSPFNEGLPTRQVSRVTVDSVGNVYASTSRGLYVITPERDLLPGASSYSVSLRTVGGNLVSAVNCGGTYIDASEHSSGPCEIFTLLDRNGGALEDGDAVSLRAGNGAFVAAEGGGMVGSEAPLRANRGLPGPWETFVIHKVGGAGRINSGDAISLQAWSGGYVAAEGGGADGCQCDSRLNANRTVPREWETFVLLMH